MSSVSFEAVLNKSPDLARTTDVLSNWLQKHEERTFIDPISLYREIGSRVTPDALIRLLAQLVAANQLRVRFRVAMPDGTLSEAEFADPKDIPPTVFDSSFSPVEVTDDRIVTVYQLPADHGR